MHTDDDVYVRVLVQGAHLQIAYTNACTKIQVHLREQLIQMKCTKKTFKHVRICQLRCIMCIVM